LLLGYTGKEASAINRTNTKTGGKKKREVTSDKEGIKAPQGKGGGMEKGGPQ